MTTTGPVNAAKCKEEPTGPVNVAKCKEERNGPLNPLNARKGVPARQMPLNAGKSRIRGVRTVPRCCYLSEMATGKLTSRNWQQRHSRRWLAADIRRSLAPIGF